MASQGVCEYCMVRSIVMCMPVFEMYLYGFLVGETVLASHSRQCVM